MKICDRCKQQGLTWLQVDGRWRLYAGQTLHACGPVAKVKASRKVVDKAKDWVSPPLDLPPLEAIGNFQHAWFSFVDGPVRTTRKAQPIAKQTHFAELVP